MVLSPSGFTESSSCKFWWLVLIRYFCADIDPSCKSRWGPSVLSVIGNDNPFELATIVAMWLSCFLFPSSLSYPLAPLISHCCYDFSWGLASTWDVILGDSLSSFK